MDSAHSVWVFRVVVRGEGPGEVAHDDLYWSGDEPVDRLDRQLAVNSGPVDLVLASPASPLLFLCGVVGFVVVIFVCVFGCLLWVGGGFVAVFSLVGRC